MIKPQVHEIHSFLKVKEKIAKQKTTGDSSNKKPIIKVDMSKEMYAQTKKISQVHRCKPGGKITEGEFFLCDD